MVDGTPGSKGAVNALDQRVSALLAVGDTAAAATFTLRGLGPEIFGFLLGIVQNEEAEDVFSSFSERLWLSLATFQGRCSVRSWCYVLARHEISRHRRGTRRRPLANVPISELESILAAARTASQSAMASEKRRALTKLRDELSVEDRTLLVLRIDRNLSWEDIALVFSELPETLEDEEKKRECARLRKRFQLIKDRLVTRARGLER